MNMVGGGDMFWDVTCWIIDDVADGWPIEAGTALICCSLDVEIRVAFWEIELFVELYEFSLMFTNEMFALAAFTWGLIAIGVVDMDPAVGRDYWGVSLSPDDDEGTAGEETQEPFTIVEDGLHWHPVLSLFSTRFIKAEHVLQAYPRLL